jgi:hypothetical protein
MSDGKHLATAVCRNEGCSLCGVYDETWVWQELGFVEFLHDEDEACPECGENREIIR